MLGANSCILSTGHASKEVCTIGMKTARSKSQGLAFCCRFLLFVVCTFSHLSLASLVFFYVVSFFCIFLLSPFSWFIKPDLPQRPETHCNTRKADFSSRFAEALLIEGLVMKPCHENNGAAI